MKKQDDAAEDPLAACLGALAPDTKLYYSNKLMARGRVGGGWRSRAPGPICVHPSTGFLCVHPTTAQPTLPSRSPARSRRCWRS